MTRIRLMSEAVANQIAAGEVVERPASVVKELVENSLDAGATSVFVRIDSSAKDHIRVADNGIGMAPQEVPMALQRHATSKLFSVEDLSNILTLGFRGEALPSIASVSHFTLRTREVTADSGYEVVFEAGQLIKEGPVGLPVGTVVDVQRLFANVPARRKFLRTDTTESSHVLAQVTRMAVCYPDVHFRLERGKRTVLDASSVSSVRDRIFQIEKSWVESAISLNDRVGSLGIQAWLAPPAEARGRSSRFHFYVNGRYIKDRILSHALMEAYRQVSSKSGHPRGYLFLEIPPDKVDVNVHPAKSEVRFVDQKLLHEAVFSAVRNALQTESKSVSVLVSNNVDVQENFLDVDDRSVPVTERQILSSPLKESPRKTSTFVEFAHKPPTPIGQFRNSYILAADDSNVWLVDQHAAHERILYEGFIERGDTWEQQLLLSPLTLELTPSELVTMEQELLHFENFGYDIESFGGDSYIVRAVPASLSGQDTRSLLRSALGEPERECRSSPLTDAHNRIAARLACHAAIKVNFPLAMEKMHYLLKMLWSSRVPSVCPHGRPTTLRVGLEQIEKKFGRI